MGSVRLTTRAVVALAAPAAIGLGAATAIAGVTVYGNKFARRADVRELRHAEGKHCHRAWRRKAESLRVDVERGPEVCGYRPPVEGDGDGPDHGLRAKEKLLRTTPKSVRRGAYVAIAVRSDRSAAGAFPPRAGARRSGGSGSRTCSA
jgi:hypothetical protein